MSSCNNIHTSLFLKNVSHKANPALDSHKNIIDNNNYKKTSLSPLSSGFGAGMTVEASLAVPLFLFFIANILSLFLMYERFSKNLSQIHQTGKNLAMLAHSADMGGDLVYLTKEQSISPFVKEIAFKGGATAATVYIRKWTGYDVMSTDVGREEEEYVYITESGVVYHRSRNCSHLKVSISVVNYTEVSQTRNYYGQKYKPCEKCANGKSTGLIFITDKGDKYHNSASCSGLKRTIQTVPLSKVGARGPCSLCGGE